jgi:hypothetical protein
VHEKIIPIIISSFNILMLTYSVMLNFKGSCV